MGGASIVKKKEKKERNLERIKDSEWYEARQEIPL